MSLSPSLLNVLKCPMGLGLAPSPSPLLEGRRKTPAGCQMGNWENFLYFRDVALRKNTLIQLSYSPQEGPEV